MPSFVYPLLVAFQVIVALVLIVLVLMQQGKGADMGSSFGSGSAGSIFGSAGSANFFSRVTKWLAVLFFASTLGLVFLAAHRHSADPAAAPTQQGAGLLDQYSDLPDAPDNASTTPPAAEDAVPGGTTADADEPDGGAAESDFPANTESAASSPHDDAKADQAAPEGKSEFSSDKDKKKEKAD